MSLVFKDSLFDAQWLRAVGHSSSGGAEIAECVAAAGQIREPNAGDWFRAWSGLAERVFAQGEASGAGGHLVSARASYLRASNYFRTAFTFLIGEPVDPRLVAAYRRHRVAFEAAAALMSPSAERITIPSSDGALHGYLFRPAADGSPRPTLIITGDTIVRRRRPISSVARRRSSAATPASPSTDRARDLRSSRMELSSVRIGRPSSAQWSTMR